MTAEQIQFVTANQIHFDLVLNHGQHFQNSHDTAKKVLEIANTLPAYKDSPVQNCTGCITEAYQEVWKAYQLNQDKPNGKKEEKK